LLAYNALLRDQYVTEKESARKSGF